VSFQFRASYPLVDPPSVREVIFVDRFNSPLLITANSLIEPFGPVDQFTTGSINGLRQLRFAKAKGDLSREIALLSESSKIRVGTQITTDFHFRIVRSFRAEPAPPVLFRHSNCCKSFLDSIHKQPVSWVLCESRCRSSRWLLSTLFYWKISPPFIRKILRISP
jgi:hypothetical protein